MKSIKNHLMFILPLVTILLSIEFFIIFERVTQQYEEELKQGYSMLIVAKKPLEDEHIKNLDSAIAFLEEVPREKILEELAAGLGKRGKKEILSALPHFYNLSLDVYLSTSELEALKERLEAQPEIERVELFGDAYASNYRLFSLMKLILKLFVAFMTVVSLFLVIKQMEIWRYEHKERMQVMEIFGAPLMLRSGILFKVAFFDAIFASVLTAGVFYLIKEIWAPQSGIEVVLSNQEKIFVWLDLGILIVTAMLLVLLAVFWVILTTKEEEA